MSKTQKPPLVLYFRENISTVFMDGSHMNNRFGQAFANRKRESDDGPYVHLDQFMEEVEKRSCQKIGNQILKHPRYDAIALRELAKELKEGNENQTLRWLRDNQIR